VQRNPFSKHLLDARPTAYSNTNIFLSPSHHVDINTDLAKNSTDTNTVELKFLMDLFQYNQKINEPTRVIIKDSQTLIHHFYTNKCDFITSAGVSKITISDHYLIYGVRKFPSPKGNNNILEYRDFKRFNAEAFGQGLNSLGSLNLEHCNNVNKAWLIWKSNFTKIIDKHAPLKKRRLGKTRAPWINKNLLTNKWRKNNLKRKACKTNNPSD
jgi:hypothetical protein